MRESGKKERVKRACDWIRRADVDDARSELYLNASSRRSCKHA